MATVGALDSQQEMTSRNSPATSLPVSGPWFPLADAALRFALWRTPLLPASALFDFANFRALGAFIERQQLLVYRINTLP